jgi:hypothetical protein
MQALFISPVAAPLLLRDYTRTHELRAGNARGILAESATPPSEESGLTRKPTIDAISAVSRKTFRDHEIRYGLIRRPSLETTNANRGAQLRLQQEPHPILSRIFTNVSVLTVCSVLIGVTIMALFLGETTALHTLGMVPASFLSGVLCFVLALSSFLAETFLATRVLQFGKHLRRE